MFSSLENYISDYCASEHFMFLDAPLKEQAESLLNHFLQKAEAEGKAHGGADSLKAAQVEKILMEEFPKLQLDLAVKKGLPDLFIAFFGYLRDTGRFPPASAWQFCAETIKPKFLNRLREDGSVRGNTFKKQYTDVGRNDPCPCGSGQKFKKCCMPLISG